MYQDAETRDKTAWRTTNSISIRVGVHHSSALSPFPFIMLMDDLTGMGAQASPCMFADDITDVGGDPCIPGNSCGTSLTGLEPNGLQISR